MVVVVIMRRLVNVKTSKMYEMFCCSGSFNWSGSSTVQLLFVLMCREHFDRFVPLIAITLLSSIIEKKKMKGIKRTVDSWARKVIRNWRKSDVLKSDTQNFFRVHIKPNGCLTSFDWWLSIWNVSFSFVSFASFRTFAETFPVKFENFILFYVIFLKYKTYLDMLL